MLSEYKTRVTVELVRKNLAYLKKLLGDLIYLKSTVNILQAQTASPDDEYVFKIREEDRKLQSDTDDEDGRQMELTVAGIRDPQHKTVVTKDFAYHDTGPLVSLANVVMQNLVELDEKAEVLKHVNPRVDQNGWSSSAHIYERYVTLGSNIYSWMHQNRPDIEWTKTYLPRRGCAPKPELTDAEGFQLTSRGPCQVTPV
ncbi:MAG: hypothetical protein V4490_03110 [Pseudomonadota bacterium]